MKSYIGRELIYRDFHYREHLELAALTAVEQDEKTPVGVLRFDDEGRLIESVNAARSPNTSRRIGEHWRRLRGDL